MRERWVGCLANIWGKDVTECLSNVTGDGTQAVNSTIATGNYSTSIDSFGTISVSNASSVVFPDAACSYNWYNTSRPDWALADDAAIGLAEYGNWFKIIVIVGVASVVLSLIFMAFGRRQGAGIGGNY